jgi:rubrerythrin
MATDKFGEEKKYSCRRCGGLGTIPTPDGKHNEICPICGGSGEGRKQDSERDNYWH